MVRYYKIVASLLLIMTATAQANYYKTPRVRPHLHYYGGPVVSNIKVVSVLWGPHVNTQIAQAMPAYLTALIQSKWIDSLCEYNTLGKPQPSRNQSIGRGEFVAQCTITPFNHHTILHDSDIETELAHQLDSGNLPAPEYDAQGYAETLYMIEFPPGITISLGGSSSCQSGGFCAYHSAMIYKHKTILYSVHPDFGPGSGCDHGCGNDSLLQNVQAVHSHELAETITDPEVGLASHYAPPLAWYDPQNGENADICDGQVGKIVVNGKTYTVQKLWSNNQKACIVINANITNPPVIHGRSAVNVGSYLTLTAGGGIAPYQWYFNNVPIPGNHAATLMIKKASKHNAGTYRVRSSCGKASAPFHVTVN